MSREEIHKLLGGYATGTLTPEEQQLLFEAALEDQELFNELAQEQTLRDLLHEPGAKTRLLAALEARPRRWYEVLSWRPLAPAAALAGVAVLVFLGVRHKPEPAGVAEVAQVSRQAPAPASPAPVPPPAATQPGSTDSFAPAQVPTEASARRNSAAAESKPRAKSEDARRDVATAAPPPTPPAAAVAPPPPPLGKTAMADAKETDKEKLAAAAPPPAPAEAVRITPSNPVVNAPAALGALGGYRAQDVVGAPEQNARALFYGLAPASGFLARDATAVSQQQGKQTGQAAEVQTAPMQSQSQAQAPSQQLPSQARSEQAGTQGATSQQQRRQFGGAALAPMRTSVAGRMQLGVRVTVMRKEAGGAFAEIDPDALKAGDTVALRFETNDSGFLYAVDAATGQQVVSRRMDRSQSFTTAALRPGITKVMVLFSRQPQSGSAMARLRETGEERETNLVQKVASDRATYVVTTPASQVVQFPITLTYK